MKKKTKIAAQVIAKICKSFPETRAFIEKAYSEGYRREKILVDEVISSLIRVVNVFLCYVVMVFCTLF